MYITTVPFLTTDNITMHVPAHTEDLDLIYINPERVNSWMIREEFKILMPRTGLGNDYYIGRVLDVYYDYALVEYSEGETLFGENIIKKQWVNINWLVEWRR